MGAPLLEIRGSCTSWAILRDGVVIAQVNGKHDMAVAKAATLERKQASARRRPCLCCRKTFLSEGPHNRLCNICRVDTGGLA